MAIPQYPTTQLVGYCWGYFDTFYSMYLLEYCHYLLKTGFVSQAKVEEKVSVFFFYSAGYDDGSSIIDICASA